MSFVVERYLPGLDPAELVRLLQRLDRVADALRREGTPVRYLGSTIVPDDEACYCQFEAPSAEIVAELNVRAGLRVDRIVAVRAVAPRPSSRGIDRTKGASCAAR